MPPITGQKSKVSGMVSRLESRVESLKVKGGVGPEACDLSSSSNSLIQQEVRECQGLRTGFLKPQAPSRSFCENVAVFARRTL